MILGMSTSTFTLLHVVISFVGIFSGFVVMVGMLNANRPEGWMALFLASTVLTSVTGFLFPSTGFTPAQGVGALSLVVLAVTLIAIYIYSLVGRWRWIYVVGAIAALYLNVFVAIVQAFQKLPFLHSLASTQSEPPFLIAQIAVMAIFIVLGILATRRFHPRPSVALKWLVDRLAVRKAEKNNGEDQSTRVCDLARRN